MYMYIYTCIYIYVCMNLKSHSAFHCHAVSRHPDGDAIATSVGPSCRRHHRPPPSPPRNTLQLSVPSPIHQWRPAVTWSPFPPHLAQRHHLRKIVN